MKKSGEMCNKKYIVIGNGQGWCSYGWKSIENDENIVFYDDVIDISASEPINTVCRKHFSFNRKYIKALPFKWIWYRPMLNALKIDNQTEYVFIFYDWGGLAKDMCFMKFLRKNIKHLKLVYMFTNIIKISGAVRYGTLNMLPHYFDKIFAFDRVDSNKYHFDFTPLIYSKSPTYKENEKTIDVFYIGNAKDRLDDLHSIYQKCVASNLSCLFYINGVPRQSQLYPNIHYNERLTYEEVLKFISHAKCMVDAIQSGSTAMTIKVCESVLYDKKLITTNENIVKESYYDESRFLLYDEKSEVENFVRSSITPYSDEEKAYFSPQYLFNRI